MQGFSGYAQPIDSRYRLKDLPDPTERKETLKILHSQELHTETSYLQLLKNADKQTLSLFRFCRLTPANSANMLSLFSPNVKPDSSSALKCGVFSGVFIKTENWEYKFQDIHHI